MPSSAMIVPSCPSGVVFCREDFLYDAFNIDGFLAKYAGNFGLEVLRDELGMYLQVLRVAMIELINDDYADFVNLSSNLVGIDERIEHIKTPLVQYKEQILCFQRSLALVKSTLESKLAQRKSLHDQRVALRNLEHIVNSLSKVERLLGLNDQNEFSEELSGDLLERVASDVNYLNFCVSKCDAKAFVQEIKPRLNMIGDKLHAALEKQFLVALEENDTDILKRCLRIYATVDRIEGAETLLKNKIIEPKLDEIINSDNLHSEPMGLHGICQKILDIIPARLQLLLKLSRSNRKQEKHFDFIGKSLWPVIVEKFDSQLPTIFSAGNPDHFHKNYIVVMEFLSTLEQHVVCKEQFHQTKWYQNFIHKWNLPVYYQIRFQEIASPVEEACSDSKFFETTDAASDAAPLSIGFHLKVSQAVLEAVNQCWKVEVFLQPLTQKFWKLSLQIIARYCKAVELNCSEEHLKTLQLKSHSSSAKTLKTTAATTTSDRPFVAETSVHATKLSPSPSSTSLAKSHTRSASDTGIDKQSENQGNSITPDQDQVQFSESELNQCLINIYLDFSKISNESLNNLLQHVVFPSLSTLTNSAKQSFTDSLRESQDNMKEKLALLSQVITNRVIDKSQGFLKQVSDIPRLYRRTNRELPTKPCTYLIALLDPILRFDNENRPRCSTQVISEWLSIIFRALSRKYLANVSEVLDGVQKMEESLRRLKRGRDKQQNANISSAPTPGGGGQENTKSENKEKGVSDDDKIRLQLFVDVKHYIQTIKSLGVNVDSITDDDQDDDKADGSFIEKLDQLVIEATKTCYDDYLDQVK